MPSSPAFLVSACLAGRACRYDGKSKPAGSGCEALITVLEEKVLTKILCCPECAGGLSTPRPPAEIEPGRTAAEVLAGLGRVLTADGTDVTEAYVKGAQDTLMLCREHNVKLAILKAKSPSCSSSDVYDGTFSGQLIPGRGVTAQLLERHGIRVMDEDDAERLIERAARLTR